MIVILIFILIINNLNLLFQNIEGTKQYLIVEFYLDKVFFIWKR